MLFYRMKTTFKSLLVCLCLLFMQTIARSVLFAEDVTSPNLLEMYYDNNAVREETYDVTPAPPPEGAAPQPGDVDPANPPAPVTATRLVEYVDPSIPTNINIRMRNYTFTLQAGSDVKFTFPLGTRTGNGGHDFHCKMREYEKPIRAFQCTETFSDGKRKGMRLSMAICLMPRDFFGLPSRVNPSQDMSSFDDDSNSAIVEDQTEQKVVKSDLLLSCTNVYPVPSKELFGTPTEPITTKTVLFANGNSYDINFTTYEALSRTDPFPKYFDSDFY